jgi:hypothetical protein
VRITQARRDSAHVRTQAITTLVPTGADPSEGRARPDDT